MSVKNEVIKRPISITILVLVVIISGLLNLIYSFTGAYAVYGVLYSAAMAILTFIAIAALSAIWGMEKWGVYLYTGLTMLKLILDFYVDAAAWWSFFFVIPVLVFWLSIRKMK